MRHLGSIVLGVVLAPLIYVLTGVGMIRLETGQGASTNWTDIGIGVGALVVAGALYAVLTMLRLSPLGPVIAALLYIVIQVWALFVSQATMVNDLGTSILGSQGAAEAPLAGTTLLLAIPLLVTIFSPRRWRAKDKPATTTAYAPPVGQSTYPQPGVPQPGVTQTDMPPVDASQVPAQPAFGQTAYGQPTAAQPAYTAPDAQTYAPPPAATAYPQPTYAQPSYPQPTSAAPAYTQVPDATAPSQPSATTAADAQEPTVVVEKDPDAAS